MGRLIFSLLVALLLWGSPVTGWASHHGPVFFVDDDNPQSDDTDGDYHFHSLEALFAPGAFPSIQENDTVIVDPGTYTGNVTIAVKGVTIKAPEGRDLTKFLGQITITAKDVSVIGLDVDATDQEFGFLVQEDNVLLQDNKAHNAKQAGIVVELGSDSVRLLGNEVFNNGTNGVEVRADSDSAQVQHNQVRSNGAIGIFVSESSDRALISDNEVTLNQSEGVKVQGSDAVQVSQNTLSSNALDGIRLEDANDGSLTENEVRASGGFGIAVVGSDNNAVRLNTLSSNDDGGVALRENERGAKRNTVENNEITGNIRAGSEGVLLEGDVSSNVVASNTISNNSFGIRLRATSAGGSPGNNNLTNNEITASPEDGIEVSGSAGRNRIAGNTISGNNKTGIRLNNDHGNDEVLNNAVFNNGHQGLAIQGSPRNTVSNNELRNNGREGLALMDGARDNNVMSNSVTANHSDGVVVLAQADNNDLEGNTLAKNRQNGVRVDGAGNLDLRDNTIQDNLAHGVALSNVTGADVTHNIIVNNNTGGVLVEKATGVDIEQNNIHSNTQFGLSAVGAAGLQADRNWWGSPRGPAGAFEGLGNAVLGVDVASQVFPWLTAPFEQLLLGSTSGEIIDDFGLDDPASFLAMDKADVDVDFFKVDPNEDGMIIASKFSAGNPQQLESLSGALKAISLLVSGLSSGTTLIDVKYGDEELDGANPETLRLYYWEPTCDQSCTPNGGHWVQLPGRSRSNVNIVEGEVPVSVLETGRILAVAPGTP